MKAKFSFFITLLTTSLLFAASAQATLLLSSLGSPYDGNFGGNPDSADNFVTGNVGLNISSIDIFWGLGNGGTTNRVGIFTDIGGLVPSTTQVGNWFTNATTITDNTTISYSGNAMLMASTEYWMVVDILDASKVGFTQGNNLVVFSDVTTQGATIIGPGRDGSAFGNIQTGSWDSDPGNLLYALNGGAAVPSPATLALFAIGIAGLGWSRRKKA